MTIVKNFGNCKTSNPRRLLLNLSDKINLKKSNKYCASSNRGTIHEKNRKVLQK